MVIDMISPNGRVWRWQDEGKMKKYLHFRTRRGGRSSEGERTENRVQVYRMELREG